MPDKKQAADMQALYVQIEEICRHFKEIRQEAVGIVATSQMPDAALHLNDVLKSTEEATNTILDAATAIGALVENGNINRQLINEHVGLIYEACSFQDISGQRIKKVLQHLNELEEQLLRLSDTASNRTIVKKPADSLLNGPALTAVAPSQADIDSMFKEK